MEIIPAIDLKGGHCVRLLQGRDEDTTEYSADPVGTAMEWVRQGAKKLHVVNLDGAFGRASRNIEVLREITAAVSVPVEFGGGLRTRPDVEQAFQAGAAQIVLGTLAIENPMLLQDVLAFHGTDKVIVALDSFQGKVATRGWKQVTEARVLDVARMLEQQGVRTVLHTDISRDGMLTGPDLETLNDLLARTGLDVIASGGVGSRDDIIRLRRLQEKRLIGVIVGKALYEGTIRLPEILDTGSG